MTLNHTNINGQVVMLKSGGFLMIAWDCTPVPPFLVTCIWHDQQGQPHEEDYPIEFLMPEEEYIRQRAEKPCPSLAHVTGVPI